MPNYQNIAVSPGAASNDSNNGGTVDWGNLLGQGVGAGLGALSNYYGNSNATNAITTGQQNAIGTQNTLQGQLQGIYGPQRGLGNLSDVGLGKQLGLFGSPDFSQFYNSPGYQFATQQGDQAIQRQASANGNLYTPNELAMLGQYNTGYASQNYNNYISQLMQAAGLGAQGNSSLGSNMYGIGSNISQLQQNQGNARAGGAANSSGITSNLLGKLPWGAIGSGVGSMFGGSSNSSGVSGDTPDMSGFTNPGLQDVGTGAATDTSGFGSINWGDAGSFPSAGGQAADPTLSNIQTQSNQGVDAYQASAPDLSAVSSPASSSQSNLLSTAGTALRGANDAYGIYGGISSGTPTGYASAAVDAGKLANNFGAFGDNSAAAGAGIGAASGALGLYSGLQQGGAGGDLSAGISAAQLANEAAVATGAESAAGGAAMAGTLGAVGIMAAPLIMGLTTNWQDTFLQPKYWEGMANSLQGNGSNINTGPGGGGPDAKKYGISAAVQEALNTPQEQVPPGIQQMVWQTGLVPYGTWSMPDTGSNLFDTYLGAGGGTKIGLRRNYSE